MSILKKLFQKKESSCCNIKIKEMKEETKKEVKPEKGQKGSSCCK